MSASASDPACHNHSVPFENPSVPISAHHCGERFSGRIVIGIVSIRCILDRSPVIDPLAINPGQTMQIIIRPRLINLRPIHRSQRPALVVTSLFHLVANRHPITDAQVFETANQPAYRTWPLSNSLVPILPSSQLLIFMCVATTGSTWFKKSRVLERERHR